MGADTKISMESKYDELKSQISKRKYRQGLGVLLILLTLASYFLILNLLNQNLFQNIKSGVTNLKIIYARL